MMCQLIDELESRVLFTSDPNVPQTHILGAVGSTAIYAQYDKAHGMELYRSDGTDNGTFMLKDIYPGPLSSNPNPLAGLGHSVYFSAYDGHGYALWKTDGTVNGTVKTNGGSPSAYSEGATKSLRKGSVLFYIGRDHKLWRTNDTPAGTYPLTDRIVDYLGSDTKKLALLNGYVYFAADDGTHGKELWRSDGTVKRTKLFADVVPGKVGSAPREIVATSDRVYFVDDIQGATKEHLWKTDGVSIKLLETSSNQFSGVFAGIDQLTPLSQTLYFTEDERGQIGGADSVWQVSATANSLKRVGNFHLPRMVAPDTQGDGSKRIFFYESGSVDGSVIAIYGLRPQKPLSIVQTGLDPQRPATIVQVANDLYYSRGTDLWLSEGGKPRIVKSFPQTDRIVGVAAFGVDAHPHVIVATATASHSIVPDHADLYLSDRTTAGTVLLQQTNIFSSVTMQFTDTIFASDRSYFVVHAPANSWDLWVSDGTSAGTHVTRQFT